MSNLVKDEIIRQPYCIFEWNLHKNELRYAGSLIKKHSRMFDVLYYVA